MSSGNPAEGVNWVKVDGRSCIGDLVELIRTFNDV